MADAIFNQLPFCLQSYIEGHRWKEFRDVQKKSFDVLFNTEDHLLISAGTSSGKTEAALFPVIADIYNKKPKRISVLYISPLIALIDDQFGRVNKMLEDSGIELYCWHGDISASLKKKVIEKGNGILQITPESLENIVNRNYSNVKDIFSELKYIIIDEVHTFMNSDRGLHLLCELASIERIAKCSPRRIGLSATLSDFTIAKDWIQAGTSRNVSLIECKTIPDYNLTICFNKMQPKDSPERQKSLQKFYNKIFEESHKYNCIIFTNNRSNVESTVGGLKKINKMMGVNKEICAHHSSISKEYRKNAEERMKNPEFKCTAVATSTLELGIDVGDLDRIVHINAPQTVSSFIQKFGRSGRRNGKPCMVCICNNNYKNKLSDKIYVDLIKAVSEAELFFSDHWIEPIRYSKLPYSLLFQQTISHIRSRITSTLDELFDEVLTMYPFRDISAEDYKILIDHLIATNIIEHNRFYNTYCLSSKGDKISGHYDFGSNFKTNKEINVYCDKKLIGTIQEFPIVGGTIQLAGNTWEIISVDPKYGHAYVKKSSVNAETYWKSGRTDTHTTLLRKMYACLKSNKIYPYLDDEAKDALIESRNEFIKSNLDKPVIYNDGAYRIYPWLGTVQFDTLFRILEYKKIACVCEPPFSILIKENYTLNQLQKIVDDFVKNDDPYNLITDEDVITSQSLGKYSQYIPTELLKKQFLEDRIDLNINLEFPNP